MDRVPRMEERWEQHTRFPLLQDMLKEFIQNITWKTNSRTHLAIWCINSCSWLLFSYPNRSVVKLCISLFCKVLFWKKEKKKKKSSMSHLWKNGRLKRSGCYYPDTVFPGYRSAHSRVHTLCKQYFKCSTFSHHSFSLFRETPQDRKFLNAQYVIMHWVAESKQGAIP